MGGRWEVTTNFAFAPHVSDTPPAECHDVAKKKKILDKMLENEVSQQTIVVTYRYLRKLQMTRSNLFSKGQIIYYKLE
jgi:hypothetical protein